MTILEVSAGAKRISGYIDMSKMEAGDTVVLAFYAKVKDGGEFCKYHEETYSGVQTSPLLQIKEVLASQGAKLTMQQTAGVSKSFDYEFFEE